MAKKNDAPAVHPATALRALEGFKTDAIFLASVVHNALHFLKDPAIDKAAAAEAILPELESAHERIRKWIDAD